MCSQKNKRMIKIGVPYLVYSQIWLNLPKDNRHLFLHLPIDNCQQKPPQNTFHKCTPTLFCFYKCSYPMATLKVSQIRERGEKKRKKKKSFNCGKALLRKDIITIREAHARWSRENLTKVPYLRPKKTL